MYVCRAGGGGVEQCGVTEEADEFTSGEVSLISACTRMK